MRSKKKIRIISFILEFTFILLMMLFTRNTVEYTVRIMVLYIMIHAMLGHYQASTLLIWEEIELLMKSHLCVYFASLLLIPTDQRCGYFIIMNLIVFLLAFLFDVLMNRGIRILMRNSSKERLLIIGTGKEAIQLAQVCKTNRFTLMEIVGFVAFQTEALEQHDLKKDYPVYDYQQLGDVIENADIDCVIIAIPDIDARQMDNLNKLLFNKVEKIKYLPRTTGLITFDTKVQDFDGLLVISTAKGKQGKGSLLMKRMIDILGGLAGCVLLIPLILLVRKKNHQNGDYEPIFFTQERMGKNGKLFKIYKFRTMVPHAEEILEQLMEDNAEIREEYEKNKKLRDDPRITAAGKLLREKSLDEFPQFLNVLKGEMSLVGPRPYLPREIKDMKEYYSSVVGCLPGVTGMWQSHGRSDVCFEDRLEMDDYYYRNWSIWLDITILIKTVKMVFKGEGAL